MCWWKSFEAIHDDKHSGYFVGDFLDKGGPNKLFVDGQTKEIELRHSLSWFGTNLLIRNGVSNCSLIIIKYHKFPFFNIAREIDFNHTRISSISSFIFSDNCSVCKSFQLADALNEPL